MDGDELNISHIVGTGLNRVSVQAHTENELVICRSKRTSVVTKDGSWSLSGYFAIFIPEGFPHQQINAPQQCYERYAFRYGKDYLDGLLPASLLPPDFTIIELTEYKWNGLAPLLGMLEEGLGTRGGQSGRRRRLLFALLCNELFDGSASATAQSGNSKNVRIIGSIRRYIDSNYAEKLSIDMLAGMFFISRATLSRWFCRVMDMSVNEYIAFIRIGRAKNLLLKGTSVNETAEQCGFSSSAYFIRFFKAKVGVTPSRFTGDNE